MRTSQERRELLLSEFERSGVSGARFADMAGIKYQPFAGWLRARRGHVAGKKRTPKRRQPVTWVEAMAGPAAPAAEALRAQLPGGAWMELCPGAQLRTGALLLRELAGGGGGPC